MMTVRNVGAVPGIAIPGMVAVQFILIGMGGQYVEEAAPAQLTPGFQAAFLAGMVVCVVVAVISASINGKREGSGTGE
jgi:hypothetical protein